MKAVHFSKPPSSKLWFLMLLCLIFAFSSCEKLETGELQDEVVETEETVAETESGGDLVLDLTEGLKPGEEIQEAVLDEPISQGELEFMDNGMVVFHADSTEEHDDHEILIKIRIRTHVRKIVRHIRIKIWRNRPCVNIFRPDFAKTVPVELLEINVLANDRIRQCVGDDVKIEALEVVRGPLFGKAGFTDDGILQYAAPPNFRGIDLLVYAVKLSNGRTGYALVTIYVKGEDELCRIKIREDRARVEPGDRVKIEVLANDRIRECVGDDVKIESLSIPRGPLHGKAEFIDGGILVYAAPADFKGFDLLVYQVALSDGQVGRALVTIKVGGEDDQCAILLLPDTARAKTGEPTKIDVLENDKIRECISSVDAKIESIEILDAPKHGKAEFTDDNILIYTSREDYVGRDYLTYGLKFSNGRKARTFVAIKVVH